MDQQFRVVTVGTPNEVGEVLGDLQTYPNWLDIISDVVAVEDDDAATLPRWAVTLRAKIGPFARSKRLTMMRDIFEVSDQQAKVRFIRHESDGLDHAPWIMTATVTALDNETDSEAFTGENPQSRTEFQLQYGGSLWAPPLEKILAASAERAGRKLAEYMDSKRDV